MVRAPPPKVMLRNGNKMRHPDYQGLPVLVFLGSDGGNSFAESDVTTWKLDGVAPLMTDPRPTNSTTFFLHVTRDMANIVSKFQLFSSNGLGVMMF